MPIDWGKPFRAIYEFGRTLADVSAKFKEVRDKTESIEKKIDTITNETIKMVDKVAQHHSDIGHLKTDMTAVPQQIDTRAKTLKTEAEAAVANRAADLKNEVYAALNTRILELERETEKRDREREDRYRELERTLKTDFDTRFAALDAYKSALTQAALNQLRQEVVRELTGQLPVHTLPSSSQDGLAVIEPPSVPRATAD